MQSHHCTVLPGLFSLLVLPACICALLLLTQCRSGKISVSKPAIDSSIVFDPGQTYSTTRIPALAVTKKGTLLAFCEGRLSGAGDWAAIDILLRRSTNGGRSWEDVRTLVRHLDDKPPTSNATPIVDKDGVIHLLYQRNYERAYHITSSDEGKTWSEPVDITYAFDAFRSKYDWKVLAPGPGHAIQLRTGRLLVPIWLCKPDKSLPGGDHRPSCIATVYSDDAGKTWHPGDIVASNGDLSGGTSIPIVNPSENVAIELADGRVMLNMRTESLNNRRLISYSPDGATNWTKPRFDDELYEPVCMAGLIRISGNGSGTRKRILFVNPNSINNPKLINKNNFRTRENLTARLSYDEGESWPVEKILWPGLAGYSDLAVDKEGTIYCLYERRDASDNFQKYRVALQKFNIAWLTDGKDNN
ncbi:MAG: exo-alpha-sialidase [Williamsia sp.]|nr:exo-alpha-sialidase [Williamsia sp.]